MHVGVVTLKSPNSTTAQLGSMLHQSLRDQWDHLWGQMDSAQPPTHLHHVYPSHVLRWNEGREENWRNIILSFSSHFLDPSIQILYIAVITYTVLITTYQVSSGREVWKYPQPFRSSSACCGFQDFLRSVPSCSGHQSSIFSSSF